MSTDQEREHQAKLSIEAYLAKSSNRKYQESLLKKIKFDAVQICELMNIPLIPVETLPTSEKDLKIESMASEKKEETHAEKVQKRASSTVVVQDEMKAEKEYTNQPIKKRIANRNPAEISKSVPEKNHSRIIEHYLNRIAADLSLPKPSEENYIPFEIDRNPDQSLALKKEERSRVNSPFSRNPTSSEADVEETIMEAVSLPSIPTTILPSNKKKSLVPIPVTTKDEKETSNRPIKTIKEAILQSEKESFRCVVNEKNLDVIEKPKENHPEIPIPDAHRDIVPDQNPETIARLATHESFLEQFTNLWDSVISSDSSLEWRNLFTNMAEATVDSNWVPVDKEEVNTLIRKRNEITQEELSVLESLKKSKLKMK